MEARSTTHGTPVKSYRITLAGLKGISILYAEVFSQAKMFSTSDFFTANSSQFLIALSSKTLIE
jgi:hypothetical protein